MARWGLRPGLRGGGGGAEGSRCTVPATVRCGGFWQRTQAGGEVHLRAPQAGKQYVCLSLSFTLHPSFLDFPFLGTFTPSFLHLPPSPPLLLSSCSCSLACSLW